jgi:hypothetical protein
LRDKRVNEKALESTDLSSSPNQTSSEQASHKLLADSHEKPSAPRSTKAIIEDAAASLLAPAQAFVENARVGLVAPIQATAELYDHASGSKTAEKIAQFAGKPKESDDPLTKAFATAGSAAGTALWMILLHKGGTSAVAAWKDTKVLSTGQRVGISAGSGLFFGSVLTPTGSSDKDWVTHRVQNGVASGLAFATLSRSTEFLGKAGIRNPMVAGFISGVPGGIVDTESRYVMGQSDNANPLRAIETYAILGGAFGATSIFKAPVEPLAKAPVPTPGDATFVPTSKVAPASKPETQESKPTYPPETNGYTGYFISPESKSAITNNLTIDGQNVPMKWEPARTFHVTEAFGVKAGAIEPWLNESKTTPPNLKAIGYAVDNTGVEALLVSKNGEIQRSDGKYYHVTRSLAEGRTANESIGLLDKAMAIHKAQVEGRIADIDPADAQRYSFRAFKPEEQFSLSAQAEFHVTEQTEKAVPVAHSTEVDFESLPPRNQVVSAVKNTPEDYLTRTIETRTAEHRAGSYFDLPANKVREALFRANWEPYDPLDSEGNHIIGGGARGYRATIAGGRLGMIATDAVPPDAQLYLIDPKGTGKWSVSTVGAAEPHTDTATMIVGPNEAGTSNQIWTFHPGEPVRSSQLDSSSMSGLLKDAGVSADGLPESGLGRRIPITKAQLDQINDGLPDSAKMTLAKIESADNVPPPVIPESPPAQAIPNVADRVEFKKQLAQIPEGQRQGYESILERAVKNPNEVARTTAVRGVTFQMSRLNRTMSQGLETVIADPVDSEPVAYRGFSKKAANLAEPPLETKKSPIQFDIALQRENAAPYAYEVKSSPRMLYGEETQQLNQVLKYQQAIDNGTISGATIEVTGRVSPDLVHWLNGKNVGDASAAPDVEVLYSMPLPSGADYTFILKRAQGDNGLKFTNDDKVYTPEDKKIIAGAYKAIQDRTIGDIISGTHLDNAPDTLAAYAHNPMTIEHLNEFNQYDAVRQENIWAKLDAKNNSDRVNVANPRNAVSEYNTREYVEEATRWSQDHLRQNPQASKSKQAYLIGSEDGIERVIDRAYDRAQVIKNFEETRAASDTEQARREDRVAKGYTGRPEGVSLDMEHIIMDATAEENKSASRRGRNYDTPERFMTVDQVTDYLNGQDRRTVDANIYDPTSGQTTTKSNISEKELARTNTTIAAENLQRAKTRVTEIEQRFGELSSKEKLNPEETDELKSLTSRHNGWNMHKGSILKAETQIEDITKERKAAGVQNKGPVEGQTKEEFIAAQRERAAQFDSRVSALNQQLQQRYKEVMGGDNEWNKIAKHVDAKESNIIKFMYTVNADGSVPLTEEILRGEVTGRAAHSELAQGRNVYGAGELVFMKSADTGRWVLSEINNASGHYRPPGTETLPYVRNQIKAAGVDVSHAILNDALQRGTPLVDAHLMDGGP